MMTMKDSYPIPRLVVVIDSLGDTNFLIALDAYSGYWQIAMRPGDRPRAAFVCHSSHLQYTGMTFGLTNASDTFQRSLDLILFLFNWCSRVSHLHLQCHHLLQNCRRSYTSFSRNIDGTRGGSSDFEDFKVLFIPSGS